MINIELVKVTLADGTMALIGRRFQDRYNLAMLGIKVGIKYERNQTAIKSMRRRLAGMFTVSVVRNATVAMINPTESAMLPVGVSPSHCYGTIRLAA